MSDQQEQIKGRLFLYGALEPRDELDERLEKCHKDMVSSVGHLREMEAYNQLNDKVNQSKENHEDINLALLYSILTNPTTASKQYHTLTLVNRDSFLLVISFTEKMVMERTTKLQETTRIQLMWLTREVVQTGVAGADKLCFALLKQLPAGSCSSSGDIYIAENLMCILMDNRDWLDSQPGLISSVVYTYLSLIPCHTLPTLTSLREQEVQFCVTLIRTRFNECFQIGRDFVRLLQGVSRIPEITELWRDLINNPQAISPQCTGLSQLLSRRTSRRFIGGRVLLEVEIKLTFFLSKVKFGQHRRYQEWFQKKYLSGPESHHLIPELIRFVCCVIHPTNEVLGSDVIPRWALIGWLISLCQSNHLAFANAKLALFYDWLSYSSDSDNIMNIEPGILLMHHSLRAHPQVTASLLDFLCRMVLSFCPSQPQIAEVGIKSALKDILNKGVLLSLDPIFESPRLDEDLRSLVKSTFPEFFQPLPTPQNATPPSANPSSSSSSSSMEVLEIAAGGGQEVGGGASKGSGEGADDPMIIEDDYLQGEDSEVTSAFSDPEDMEESMEDSIEVLEQEGSGPNSSLSEKAEEEEELIPLSAVDLEGGEDPNNNTNKKKGSGGESCDPWAQIGELPSHLEDKMLELKTEGDEESRVRLMEEVLQLIKDISDEANEVNSDPSVPSLVATPLADLLATEFACTSLMEEEEKEKEDEEEREREEGAKKSKRLCHQLFRELVATDSADSAILSLARTIRKRQSRVGYFFLCYLHRRNHTPSPTNESSRFEPYRKLVEEEEREGEGGGDAFKEMLLNDLKECAESDSGTFFHLLPSLCKQFSLQLMGEELFLSLIVSHIDPAQLSAVMHQLMNKEYQLFGRQPSKLHKILMESLQWESFEQFSMWQLLNAEGPDPSLVIPSLADMNSKDHPEAISSALLFLKNESSGYSSIASLLSLPTDHAPLVEVIGGRWVSGRPTKCAKFLSQFLEGLEKKHSDKYPVQEVNLVLGHLQSILHLLNSKQIMEASEAALQKTLAKQFKSYPQLASTFRDLNKLVSSLGQPADISTAPTSKKDASGGKRGQGASAASAQEKSSSKHEPKPKRRRITNRDEILVIDP